MRISDWSSDVCSSDLHGFDTETGLLGRLERRQNMSVAHIATSLHRRRCLGACAGAAVLPVDILHIGGPVETRKRSVTVWLRDSPLCCNAAPPTRGPPVAAARRILAHVRLHVDNRHALPAPHIAARPPQP